MTQCPQSSFATKMRRTDGKTERRKDGNLLVIKWNSLEEYNGKVLQKYRINHKNYKIFLECM